METTIIIRSILGFRFRFRVQGGVWGLGIRI